METENYWPQSLWRSHWSFPWLVAALLIASLGFAAATTHAEEMLDYRLQIGWQPASTANFSGTISIDAGKFSELRNLSLHGGTTGGLWFENNGRALRIRPSAQVQEGGVQFRVVAPRDAKVTISLGHNNESPIILPLSELAKNEKTHPLLPTKISNGQSATGEISIRRLAGDSMRLDFNRSAMIFEVGDSLPIVIKPNGVSVPANVSLHLLVELHRARDAGRISSERIKVTPNSDGEFSAVPHVVQVPSDEAVYELKVSLQIDHRFQRDETLFENTTQFIALSPTSSFASESTSEAKRSVSNWPASKSIPLTPPTERTSWLKDRLPQWLPETIRDTDIGPWSSGPTRIVQRLGDAALELPERSWYALRLNDLRPGKPYQLTIRIPIDQSAKLQATIVEPDASGKIESGQIDTAIVLPRPIWEVPTEWAEHKIVFWSRSATPIVLLTNHETSRSIAIGPMTLNSGVDHLPASIKDEAKSIPAGSDAVDVTPHAGRLALLHVDTPNLVEVFGASLAIDAIHGATRHDWVAFHESATRLAEYVKWAGYGGTVMTVASEGGSLYPAESFTATPRFDRGVEFSNGQDIFQKDVLELLLCVFDREGLTFVPVLDLGTPLPALEKQLAAEGDTVGIAAVNAQGNRLKDTQVSSRGSSCYYNATDSRVQQAIQAACLEVVRRCENHRSFGGLALQLGANRLVQLPDAQWTADKGTITQFQLSLPGKIPGGIDPAVWACDVGRSDFLKWRSNRLSQLFIDLGTHLDKLPLYLVGADTTESHRGNTDPDLECGFDWELLGAQPNVIPLRLYRSRPLGTVPQMVQDAALDSNSYWDRRLDALPQAGAVLITPPEIISTAGQLSGPWTLEQNPKAFQPHAVVGGSTATMHLAAALVAGDRWPLLLGGRTPAQGSESVTSPWLATYQALPPQRFEKVPRVPPTAERTSLIEVRRVNTSNGFYVYAINPAPWASNVKIRWHNPNAAIPKWLGGQSPGSTLTAKDLQSVLTPGALLAVRIDDPQADVHTWSDEPMSEESLRRELENRLRELSLLTASQHFSPGGKRLINGDFETPGEGVPGWLWSQHSATSVTRTNTSAGNGKFSLRLENKTDTEGVRAWVVSEPITISNTGRLALLAKLKVDGNGELPAISMAIEGRVRGKPFREALTIGKPEAGPLPRDNWAAAPYRLEAVNLPTEGIDDLRVAFDMVGCGVVWIDDVQIAESFITARERARLHEEIYLAVERLKTNDLVLAGRLLASPWARALLSMDADSPRGPVAELTTEPITAPSTASRIRGWLPSVFR